MARHRICRLDELAVEKLTPAKLGHATIVLWRSPSGSVKAFFGRCPHQGADLTFGCVTKRTSSDRLNKITTDHQDKILRCPWHGFEFSLETGRPIVPESAALTLRLRLLEVEIEDDQIVVVT